MLKTKTSMRIFLACFLVVLIGCGRREDEGFAATVKGSPPLASTGTLVYQAPLSDRPNLSKDGLVPSSVTRLRFRGLDNGGVPVFGPVTLDKASALTLEKVPTTVDKLVVELLTADRILAAATVPVRLSAVEPSKVKNPYFFTLAPQDIGQGEGEGGSHGYIYHLASLARSTVTSGADIPLSTNGPVEGVDHRAGSSEITVSRGGAYLVEYRATFQGGIGASVGLALDGEVLPATVVTCHDSLGVVSGKAILRLNAGDVLTLRNNSPEAITLALGPKVGVQVGLIQLGP